MSSVTGPAQLLEERYRALVEQLPAVTYLQVIEDGVGARRRTIYVSPQVERLFGYTPEQFADDDFRASLARPDDVERIREQWREAFATGGSLRMEYRLRAADGSEHWVRNEASIIRDAAGKPALLQGLISDITDLKETQARLEESEQELTDFFENSTISLHMVDAAGTILRANQAELDLLGYTREEYVGRDIREFHADPDVIDSILERLARHEPVRNQPARLRCKDGSIRHVLIDSSVFERDGKFVHTRCFTRDITAEHQAEEQRNFLAQATEILSGSLDYRTTLVNVASLAVPRLADWCGIQLADEAGQLQPLVVTHVDPSKVEMARELQQRYPVDMSADRGAARVYRTGQPEIVPEVTDEMLVQLSPDPEILQIARDLRLSSGMTVPLKARGRTLGVLSLVMAESGRHYSERDLDFALELGRRAGLAIDNALLHRQSELAREQLQQRWMSLPEAAAVLLPGSSVYLSARAAELLRLSALTPYTVADLPIYRASGIHWAAPGQNNPLLAVRDSGEPLVALEYQVRVAGQVEPILANVGPVDLAEAGAGAIMLFQPTRPIRLLDSAKTDFMRVLAHELRHPLATSRLAIELLEDEGASDEMKTYLATALREIDAMDNLVVELTDIIGAGQDLLSIDPEPVDLRELILENELSFAALAPHQEVVLELPAVPCPVVVDPQRIASVLSNLVGNAARHAPAGTRILVRLEHDAGFARVSVVDDGPGVPPEVQEKIFERYYRGDRHGSMGLGLYLARRILAYHDGQIWYDEDEGGKFCFRLPLRPPP
jgi:PAS domain S-box-containing protein